MTFYASNIKKDTLENRDFGPVVQHNDEHIQVALMSIPVNKKVPMERHVHLSQFIRVESGNGKIIINGKNFTIESGWAAIVPPNTPHEIINQGPFPLKIYTLYCKDSTGAFVH